jgi:hypothetical protein
MSGPTATPGPTGGVWFDLETLLSLPLEANALATLWREALHRLQQEPITERIQRTCELLAEAIDRHDLLRARSACLVGDWFTGLNRLVGLTGRLPAPELAGTLLELLPALHHQLIDLAEAEPSQCPFKPEDRAELLWQAHQWLTWLERQGAEEPERFAVIREQICRYGAIAWMGEPQLPARRRSLSLLLALLVHNPEARSWALQACGEQLGALIAAAAQEPPTDPHDLADLLAWCQALAPHSPQDPAEAGGLEQSLADLNAGLAVWNGWRQGQKTGRPRAGPSPTS